PSPKRECHRREWHSNPRWSFPHTRFPSVLLKPLGHLSKGAPTLPLKFISIERRGARVALRSAWSLAESRVARPGPQCRDLLLQRIPPAGSESTSSPGCSRQSCSAVRDGAVPLLPGSALDSTFSARGRMSLATGLPKLRELRRISPH